MSLARTTRPAPHPWLYRANGPGQHRARHLSSQLLKREIAWRLTGASLPHTLVVSMTVVTWCGVQLVSVGLRARYSSRSVMVHD